MAAVTGKAAVTATLAAATLDTVTLSAGGAKLAEVTNHGTGVLYVRADGTNATVAGAECQVVLAGERLAVGLSAAGTVTLISAGTPTYTVAVLN